MIKKSKISLLGVVMCVVLQLFSANVFAQSTVNGKVTDENGNALPGATIAIKGTYQGVVANVNGDYKFTNLKNGVYEFVFSFLGYESVEKRVDLKKSVSLNVELAPKSILAEEVIVAATRAGNKTPVATSNINKSAIAEQNTGQDIPYQLSLTPSLVSSSEAGTGVGNSALRIRGTDATRINITMNGVPLNDAESQGVYWVNMPDFASSVDNIQIQRGVGTSTNGAAAFGATINFQTETVNPEPYAEVQSVGGSFNTFRNTFKAGTGLINGKFAFDARYSRLKSDGFVDRAFSDHESFFVTGTYFTERSILKLNILSGTQQTGISWWGNDNIEDNGRRYNPAGKYKDKEGNTHFYKDQTDNYKQTHYQLFYSQELSDYLNLNTAVHYTKGRGYYEQYKSGKKYKSYGVQNPVYGTETITKTDLIRQKKMRNDFYGFTASLNYHKNRVNASFGGAWNKYDGDHFGEVKWASNGGFPHDYQWYFNNGKKTDFNMFAKINFEVNDKLNVFGDVQYRHISYETTGNDDDLLPFVQSHKFDFFNPKTGLFYTFNDKNSAYASFGVAHREPTRANFKDVKDNPANYPTAETLFDYEIGYNYKSTKATIGLNFYYMSYKDQLVPTGEKSSVGYAIMTNVEKSYRAGVEITGGVQLLPALKWDANITLSKNKIKNYVDEVSEIDSSWDLTGVVKSYNLGTTDISYSPDIIGSSRITWNACKNFSTAFTTKYVGKQYIDNTSNSDRQIDAYCVSNLRFQYNIKPNWVKQIGLSLQINNIFDAEYENNAYGSHSITQAGKISNWVAYFPQAGINFLAGVTVRF